MIVFSLHLRSTSPKSETLRPSEKLRREGGVGLGDLGNVPAAPLNRLIHFYFAFFQFCEIPKIAEALEPGWNAI